MAPTSTPKAPEIRRRGAEKIVQTFQKLFQRTDKFRHDTLEEKTLPLNEISERFRQYMDDVDQPKHQQVLTRMLNFNNGRELTQCICLGLGTFAINVPHSTQSNISLHQLAVLTTILRILKDRHCIQQVYFQDPDFSDADILFLQSLGYAVLEKPAACEKMSAGTFLFAPFLPDYVNAGALTVAFPGLYMGNSPARYLAGLSRRGAFPEETGIEDLDIFRRFQDSIVDGDALPSFDQQRWTLGTTVHWLVPDFPRSFRGTTRRGEYEALK